MTFVGNGEASLASDKDVVFVVLVTDEAAATVVAAAAANAGFTSK